MVLLRRYFQELAATPWFAKPLYVKIPLMPAYPNSNNIDLQEPHVVAIVESLKAVCPLETDLVGSDTVKDIVKGLEFETVVGGRHLNLMDSIHIIGTLASICHIGIVFIESRRHNTQSGPLHLDRELSLIESIKGDPRFGELFHSQPDLVLELLQELSQRLASH